jgi:enoyl-[acyl-carrier protein] reductase III
MTPTAVLITGGSSGIGRAIALHYAEPGTDVFINYHANDAAAEQTAADIRTCGARAHVVKADVGTAEGVRSIADTIRTVAGRLDIFVHCAALAVTGGALEINPEDLAAAVAVNAISLVSLTQALVPVLERGSSVVYISSRGSRVFVPSYVALGPTKALGEALIRYLAVELAPHGVRANTVSAGALDTPAFRAMFGDSTDARLDAAAKANPSGRGITVDDVVAAVDYIAGPGAAMVQGQVLMVDGGLSL